MVVTTVELCVQRLSSDCEDQIRVILQESALDYRLDPQLQMQCAEEVSYSFSFLHVPPQFYVVISMCGITSGICVSDSTAVCRGSCSSGTDRSGGGMSESESAQAQK